MPTSYPVKAGDCIASIAFEHGFFPDTLWRDPANAALREERGDPNVLVEGDQVTIPDLRPKEVSCATSRTHVFKRRGVPEKFKLQLMRRGRPRGDLPYRLEVDGAVVAEGRTDARGRIEVYIPPNASSGKLVLGESEEYELQLGRLAAADTEAGARARLVNLGLLETADAAAEPYAGALRRFQLGSGLPSSGELDAATAAKLVEAHGR